VTGEAQAALAALPMPDAIFFGGGGEPALIDKAYAALKPGGRAVANAITLDTERAVLAAQSKFGGTLTRLSVERLDAVGGKQAFRPAMTVTQWAVAKP
jgi:precorrin-6B C5,15-methyltransferase / cobalt-precorrin-6B C5,C15-methyltransferase